MRKKVDNTALDDIYTPSDEAKTEATTAEPKPEETQPESDTSPQSPASKQQ